MSKHDINTSIPTVKEAALDEPEIEAAEAWISTVRDGADRIEEGA